MPAYYDKVQIEMVPKLKDLVRLCYSKTKNIAWLELWNTKYLVDPSSHKGGEVYRVFIGAVPEGASWRTIRPTDITDGYQVPIYFMDLSAYFRFQRTVREVWNGFTPQNASSFGKGWSSHLGLKSLTSAGFVVEMLTVGFKEINQYVSFGNKKTSWKIDDLARFMVPYIRAGAPPNGLANFDAVLPNPYYDGPTYPKEQALMTQHDTRHLPLIPSLKAAHHTGNFSYAQQLQDLPQEFGRRVTYGFRGDTRGPHEIQDNGFTPNFTRPSHIQLAKQQKRLALSKDVHNDVPMDVSRFLQNQTFGEFVSLSKSVAIAKLFATTTWADGAPSVHSTDGWVYACFAEGAIEIPPQGSYTGQGGFTTYDVNFNEQELTMPGMLDWGDVVACRHVREDGSFTGPVYMHPEFQDRDSTAAPVIYDLLSGKRQGDFV